jgi:16S rRNA (cytosine1402-N4)-methyltransferase
MRFDTSQGITAKEVVNSYKKEKLYEIFRNYGEEPASKKISEAIYRARREKKIETTKDLLEIIEKNSKHPKVKTRIFQAIRIEVNKELENMEISLRDAINLLVKD